MFRKKVFSISFSLVLGAAVAFTIFALLLQRLGGMGVITFGLLVALWLLTAWVVHRWNTQFLSVWMEQLGRARTVLVMICALVCALLFMVALPVQAELVHFLFPRQRVEIVALQQTDPASTGSVVRLRPMQDGSAFQFPLSDFYSASGWVWDREMIYSDAAPSEVLVWEGSLVVRGNFGLLTGPDGGIAQVRINGGEAQEYNLFSTERTLVTIKLDPVGLPSRPFLVLAYSLFAIALWYGFAVMIAAAVLHSVPNSPRKPKPPFVLFTLPMLGVWTFYLLVFFPGVLTPDSIHQWRMIQGFEPIQDWHPAIHTILEGLLLRIVDTPAVIAGVQIALLSLVLAWGLGTFVELGLPVWAAWIAAFVMALLPTNGINVITMWKDIAYAISMVALFIIVLKLVFSQGLWLTQRFHWLALGLVAGCAALFRQNGLVVSAVIFMFSFWFFRYQWRKLLLAGGIFTLLYTGITGPLYDAMKVERVSSVLGDTILLHHFGAHVKTGTPLSDGERTYFDGLLPLSEWEYYCCTVNTIFFKPGFNRPLFIENHDQQLKIALSLAMRNPQVELAHWSCSSSFIWQFITPCCHAHLSLYESQGELVWIEPNELGLEEQSVLPNLVQPMYRLLRAADSIPIMAITWGPALQFYLALIGPVILSLRRRNWRFLLIAIPALVQSGIMMVIAIAPDFRYQYSVYLIGWMSVLFWFLPNSDPAADRLSEVR